MAVDISGHEQNELDEILRELLGDTHNAEGPAGGSRRQGSSSVQVCGSHICASCYTIMSTTLTALLTLIGGSSFVFIVVIMVSGFHVQLIPGDLI